ncbi:hypothetical protein RRG08_013107 [Elysia crispata]|uniref:Uncharacterized protein n=1 Tax=Elysia crispata TaxID=231223 RepID=A0AAE1A1N0_9GAST|nr:hypothetical protein RRG08_013107 [Elysia crispata]
MGKTGLFVELVDGKKQVKEDLIVKLLFGQNGKKGLTVELLDSAKWGILETSKEPRRFPRPKVLTSNEEDLGIGQSPTTAPDGASWFIVFPSCSAPYDPGGLLDQ